MKKILVPTDFSACASSAIDFAVESAKLIPAEITLLHSFELMGNLYTDYMGVNKEFNQQQLQEVCHKLTEIKRTIQIADGVNVDTHVCTGGVKKCIMQSTRERNIDFVVMGTTGASGLKEAIWGSKTADVIGKSTVPVIAIPCNYKWQRPAKILLATNHFEKEPEVLDLVFELADLYGAQVNVAVFTNEAEDNAVTYLENMRNTPAYGNLLRDSYQEGSLTVTNLFGKSFETTLEDHNRANDIDMVAMITYQRSFPDSIFHPSMTRHIACHTSIPLLAIPALSAE